MAKLASLQDLYVEELKDLYSAETQLVAGLPKMVEKAHAPELKTAFSEHLEQTRNQVKRLEQIFARLGTTPTGKACKGMHGILDEAKELMAEQAPPEVMDAGILSQAQHVEHYEMAGYGSVIAFANLLGDMEAVNLLETTLEEEKAADKKLTQLAEKHINRQAK